MSDPGSGLTRHARSARGVAARHLVGWILMLFGGVALPTEAREVRVGVYHNPPKIMLTESGQISGILGELLQEIASREGWKLRPVPCAWEVCLQALADGEIDLMPDVAHTEARAAVFDLHSTPALHSWSQLYRHADVEFESMLDMDGRRIAVLGGSVQQEYLVDLAEGFDIDVEWLDLPSMEAAIQSVVDRRADAVATNFHFGDWAASRQGLLQTGIIFLPSRLFFASTKDKHADLLQAIDRNLLTWRESSDSLYYNVLRRWGSPVADTSLPRYLRWSAVVLLGLLLVMAGIAALLRVEVARKTRSLRASETRLSTILNSVDASIYIKDAGLRYRYVNQKVCEFFGLPAERIIGQQDEDFFDADTAKRLRADDLRVIERGERLAQELEIPNRKSGKQRSFFAITLPLRNDKGEISELCGIATDLTEQRSLLSELHALAYFDPLTRLPNRLQMQDRIRSALSACSENAHQAALLLLNLDRFRELNDTRGHGAGDLWLQQVAQRLQQCLQGEASLARLGPDEFAFLLPQLPPLVAEAQRQVAAFAQRLLDSVAQPFELSGNTFRGTASIGATLFADPRTTVEDVLRYADLALSQAKLAGGNRMRFFLPEMSTAVAARAALETDLRHGLEAGQFLLHYQPQFDLHGAVLGFEALLRWQHPQRGLVMPGSFIPLAEASGLILPLGAWVLRQACEQLTLWSRHSDTRKLRVAVNVSARQLHQPGFVEDVLACLTASGVPGGQLELEITESQLVEDIDQAIEKLAALRTHGIRIALDDFGTGYSALNYVKRLPLDVLKIDTSFVRDLLIEPNDMAIVRTVIALGKSLGLEVLAEGVEDSAQRAVLIELGCEQFQGYLLGRPAPVSALSRWFGAQQPA